MEGFRQETTGRSDSLSRSEIPIRPSCSFGSGPARGENREIRSRACLRARPALGKWVTESLNRLAETHVWMTGPKKG